MLARKVILLLSMFAVPVSAETVNTCNFTAGDVLPGESDTFSASTSSGAAGTASGTIRQSYTGITVLDRTSSTGRFALGPGHIRYGLHLDSFLFFQSFISTNMLSVVNANTACPSATTYNWLLARFRSKLTPRGAMDAAAYGLPVGGTLVYDPNATPLFSGTEYFDLAGPNVLESPYALTPFSESCTDAKLRVLATGNAFDSRGHVLFGERIFAFHSGTGTPQMVLGIPQQELDAPTMAGLADYGFGGIYTSVEGTSSQTNKFVYLMPNGSGTTFTIREVTDLDDPFNSSVLGALACTDINSPSNGFCSGTLTSTAGTTKAVCMVDAVPSEKTIICAAQKPGDPSVGVSIIAKTPKKSVLAVSAPIGNSADAYADYDIEVTVRNITGRPATGLQANPSMSGYFAEPAFNGVGGRCTGSLKAFSSCTVPLHYARTGGATNVEIYRVSYYDGVTGGGTPTLVNATAQVIASSGLTVIEINNPFNLNNPTQNLFQLGTTGFQLSVFGRYTDSGTQGLNAGVHWTGNDPSIVNVVDNGDHSISAWVGAGYPEIMASLGTGSGASHSIYNACDDGIGKVDVSCDMCADGSRAGDHNGCQLHMCNGNSSAWPNCCDDGSSATACNTCSDGTTSRDACLVCGDGTTTNKSSCDYSCNGQSTAYANCCDDGASPSPCTTCGDGSSYKQGSSLACNACGNGVTSTSCTSCTVGSVGIKQSCTSCSNGTGGACCPDGSATTAPGNCVSCLSGVDSYQCQSCTVGAVGIAQSCTSCGDGTTTYMSCTSCDYGPTTAYSCNLCNVGGTTSGSCNSCDLGSGMNQAYPCHMCGNGQTATDSSYCPE